MLEIRSEIREIWNFFRLGCAPENGKEFMHPNTVSAEFK
jgi:hypothetical protein